MPKLTKEQVDEIKEMLEEDNNRIEHERVFGGIVARRAKYLTAGALSRRYGVSEGQIRKVAGDLL